jgi:hypothetical protein
MHLEGIFPLYSDQLLTKKPGYIRCQDPDARGPYTVDDLVGKNLVERISTTGLKYSCIVTGTD